MSESSKFRGKNAELFRASTLLTATAIWSFANGAVSPGCRIQLTPRTAPRPIEEVVVTGFRASLNKALEAKQDTGRLDRHDRRRRHRRFSGPEPRRIAAARSRRVDRARRRRRPQISVRGLGPQFTRVRINGIEAMSANGSTDASGGTNRGRNFDFNTFASELFNNITVRKTASAEIEEGSLGATVDLRTGRPFDFDGFTIAGSVQARLQRPDRRQRSARGIPHQQHLRRRQVRRAAVGRLHHAQAAGRRLEHGALADSATRRLRTALGRRLYPVRRSG